MNSAEGLLDTRKPARRHVASKKPATKKKSRALYDVAIKNGWGPRLKGMDMAIAHLKKTRA